MNEKVIIENPEPLRLYFVEHNETGERDVCSLVRGVWNRVHLENGKLFFAYQSQAVAVSEAYPCENCGKWCMYPMSFKNHSHCENCSEGE